MHANGNLLYINQMLYFKELQVNQSITYMLKNFKLWCMQGSLYVVTILLLTAAQMLIDRKQILEYTPELYLENTWTLNTFGWNWNADCAPDLPAETSVLVFNAEWAQIPTDTLQNLVECLFRRRDWLRINGHDFETGIYWCNGCVHIPLAI